MNESGNAGNNASKDAKSAVKGFLDKDFGMFKGLHILCGAAGLLVLVVIIAVATSLGGKKEVAYPALYVNSDGDLKLLAANVSKEDKAVTLVSDDGSSSYPMYANTTDRYVLFKKNGSLYLYDAKAKDKTRKIKGDVGEYGFTPNDKYVVFTVKGDSTDIYSYDYKKDPVKVESGATIEEVTDNFIIYKKDDALYVRDIKAKKDKQKVTSDETKNIRLSEDNKKLIYQNKDGDLHVYTLSSKKDVKITAEVGSYYTNKAGTKFFFTKKDDSTELHYYNGKSSEKVATDVYSVEGYDVDKQYVLYTEKDGDKETLYFKKGKKDKAKIEDGLSSVSADFGANNDIYYYYSSGKSETLKYAKISGNKVTKITELSDNYETSRLIKGGIIFVADVDKNSNGSLYIAKNGKAKKVDDDVYANDIRVSNNGKKFYYYKNYSNGAGELTVSSGGKGKVLDTDVHQFVYVKDNLIYYIKDYSKSGKGDFYRSTGGKGKKLAEDIVSLRSTPNYYDPFKK